MNRPSILFLLAYPEAFQELASFLEVRNYEVQIGPADSNAPELVSSIKPDVLVIEHHGAPRGEFGLELARDLKALEASIPIILVSREETEELVVGALRAGLQDYLSLPVSPEDLLAAVERSIRRIPRDSRAGGSRAEIGCGAPRMVGRIGPLREMKAKLERAASSNCTVLISGETGTGKELVAEFVHQNSPRRNKPFVCINCAAIPDSLLESELFGYAKGAFTGAEQVHDGLLTAANGGTIFLDEIGDMSLLAQAKILRVLERKEVCRLGGTHCTQLDIRFVAATNQDLEKMASQGDFRRDLYYRLNVAHFHLLPLRERKADIPLLADYFSREFSGQSQRASAEFSEECMSRLMQYDWPGNIRELKNLIEGLLLGETPEQIRAAHLPAHLRGLLSSEGKSPEDEREHLLSVLLSSKWNKSKAAEKLQWSRMTLYRKMAKYQIARSR